MCVCHFVFLNTDKCFVTIFGLSQIATWLFNVNVCVLDVVLLLLKLAAILITGLGIIS